MNTPNFKATANRACALLYSYICEHTKNNRIWILPVNVCPDVPLTFCEAKVSFQFVDINPHTLCIDEDKCIELISSNPNKYSGLVYVRTYGYLSNTLNFNNKLRYISPDIKIIDDRCLCVPEINPDFFNADMILYSTGRCKQIDFGIGGFAHYSSPEVFKIDSSLIYTSTNEEVSYKESYKNNKPLEIIPTGWLKLDYYDEPYIYWKKIEACLKQRELQREKLNKIYRSNLPINIQMPEEYQSWRFNIRVPKEIRNKILEDLFSNKCFASSHYHSANRLFDNNVYNNSDYLFDSIINLFNDDHYTSDLAIKTVKIINKYI